MKELLLNKDIYSENSILIAREQFNKLCKVQIVQYDVYCKCIFSECIYDENETVKEFENYLIDFINTRGKNDC